MNQQRAEYKAQNGKGKKRNGGGGNKSRGIKKVWKELKQLGELVSLIGESSDVKPHGGAVRIAAVHSNANANSNPMGGRNERQAQRDQERQKQQFERQQISSRIAELRQELNLSPVKVTVKENKISQVQPAKEYPPGTVAVNESDTNAETGVAGKNMIPLAYTNRTADVFGYLSSNGAEKDIPIVTAATAYTDPRNGQTYILIFHEFLWFGHMMDHSLINPNQPRHFGIGFRDNPYDHTRDLSIEVDDSLKIPLRYQGTKLIFESRVPTRQELSECPHVDMCSQDEWNPQSVKLQSLKMKNPKMLQLDDGSFAYLDPTDDEAIMHSMKGSPNGLRERIIAKIGVPELEDHHVKTNLMTAGRRMLMFL